MEIRFTLFPTEECDSFVHKFYQVLFLDREYDRIDAWTAVASSVAWCDQADPPEFKAVLSVRERTGNWMIAGPRPGISDRTSPDAWRAIRKIWGAQSQPLARADPITISNVVKRSKTWFGSSSVIDEYIMFGIKHGFAASKADDSYNPFVASSIIENGLKNAFGQGVLFGVLVDDTSQTFLPLALGGYTEEDGEHMRRLSLPNVDTTIVPAFWWMRHTIDLPKKPLGLGRRKQFNYEVILAKEGGPGGDRLAEYRSYLVAPQFFELEQSFPIKIETGALRPPESGPRSLDPQAELGGGDFNSLDRQQKTPEAYLTAWIEEKKIERREYYKLNLPGNVRDYRTSFNRVELGVRLKSSLAEIRLYVIGLLITLLLGIGIDGERLLELAAPQSATKWPVFLPVFSGVAQWIFVSLLVLTLYLVDLFARHGTGPRASIAAGEPRRFEWGRALAGVARWSRRLAAVFYVLWAIGAFGLNDEGRAHLADIVHSIWLIGNLPALLAGPRIFGVLALIMGLIALSLTLALQPKLVKDVVRFLFERN